MLFGSKKVRREIRSAAKALASAAAVAAVDQRTTLDAHFVLSRWRGRPRVASGDAPFALFSYYEPVSGKFNPGDAIQTIAVRHALESVGEANFTPEPVVRDELSLYDGPPIRCVMQGWFSHHRLFWPSPDVTPVFLGTHFTAPAQQFVSRLMEYAPDTRRSVEIGCRDLFTLGFCRSIGLRSYFSRCLTLTLSRRPAPPQDAKVLLVDVPEEYMPWLPEGIRRDAKVVNQRATDSDIGGIGYSPKEQKAIGERHLSLYRDEAGLVVTTAIHVAMPCLAMGIPVVFVEGPQSRDPNRYTALSGIIPIHTQEELRSGKVCFSPECPDLEPLKAAMLENLRLSVRKASGATVDERDLSEVRWVIAKDSK